MGLTSGVGRERTEVGHGASYTGRMLRSFTRLPGVVAAALFEAESGRLLDCSRRDGGLDIERLARTGLELAGSLKAELDLLDFGDDTEDLLFAVGPWDHLFRPLQGGHELLYLVLDRERVNWNALQRRRVSRRGLRLPGFG